MNFLDIHESFEESNTLVQIDTDDDELIFDELDIVDSLEEELFSKSFNDIVEALKTKAKDIEDGKYTIEQILVADTGIDRFLDVSIESDEVVEYMDSSIDLIKLENAFNISDLILEEEDIVNEYYSIEFHEDYYDEENDEYLDYEDIYDDDDEDIDGPIEAKIKAAQEKAKNNLPKTTLDQDLERARKELKNARTPTQNREAFKQRKAKRRTKLLDEASKSGNLTYQQRL